MTIPGFNKILDYSGVILISIMTVVGSTKNVVGTYNIMYIRNNIVFQIVVIYVFFF